MKIFNVDQNSEDWDALRCGKPTASAFSKILTTKGDPSKSMGEYAAQLAADKYVGRALDGWGGNEWSERGHELEDSGRAWYENNHPEWTVTKVGFITDDQERIGCSPDSEVSFDGLLEIKCLKATRHIAVIQYYNKHGKAPTGYFMQPQGQMLVSGRNWVDLLFYHPDLPSLMIRQEPDYEIMGKLEVQIDVVIAERDSIILLLENM